MSYNFKLYIKHNNTKHIITTFDSSNDILNTNLYSTFDEKIEISENDQIKLTFSIAKYIVEGQNNNINSVLNPFIKLLQIGAVLILEENNKQYNLIIVDISPAIHKDNIIYSYSCQDELSYKWSKICVGYSYSTTEKGTIKMLPEIVRDILSECSLTTWSTTYTIAGNSINGNTPFTFEIENSNAYNALIEACSTANAYLQVDYEHRQLNFYYRDQPFSGYRYYPESNLNSLDVSYSGSNLITLLHVVGGQDEYGNNISLVPYMPLPFQRYFLDNTGWKQQDIIEYTQLITNNLDEYWTYSEISLDDYDALPIQIKDKYTFDEYNNYLTGLKTQEVNECKFFANIADQHQHLGQFLFDFSFFSKNGLLNATDKQILDSIINKDMRNNNIYLRCYTQSYYDAMYIVSSFLINLEAHTSNLYALYDAIRTSIQNDNQDSTKNIGDYSIENSQNYLTAITEHQNAILELIQNNNWKEALQQLYGNKLIYDIPEYKDIQDKINRNSKIRDESSARLLTLNAEIANIQDKTSVHYLKLESEIDYYTDRYNTAISLCGEDRYGNYKISDDVQVPGMYFYISQLISSNYQSSALDTVGIIDRLNIYNSNNKKLWNKIYSKYGDYIYEGEYTNSDEMNSFSLYNQAVLYFEDYKYPTIDCSVKVLNLSSLEQVGTANLSVGSCIRIYNKDLNLLDEQESSIQYKNNELIVQGLSYELRKSSDISINVEQITPYQKLLQKMIQKI